ncbi:MAG: hypothetical protein ACRCUY_06995 [Thermoguttaceae bacterium]
MAVPADKHVSGVQYCNRTERRSEATSYYDYDDNYPSAEKYYGLESIIKQVANGEEPNWQRLIHKSEKAMQRAKNDFDDEPNDDKIHELLKNQFDSPESKAENSPE